MGVIFWIALRVLHVLKPFVKIALIESLIEALSGYIDEETTEPESETETEAQ